MRSSTVVLALVLVACSRSSEGSADAGKGTAAASGKVGSCDRSAAVGTCSEYAPDYLAQNESLVTQSCTRLGGTFVYAECPNTSIVGACRLSTGESRKFYGTGGSAYDPERARKECETTFHGSWQGR